MTDPKGSYSYSSLEGEMKSEELRQLMLRTSAIPDINRKIFEWAGIQPHMDVLDIGCGPGLITAQLASFLSPGHITGIDIDDQLLTEARKKQQESGLENVVFQKGDVYNLDFPAASFDFVYARLLFQHLSEAQLALDNMTKLLKPGGIVCISDIDDNWLSIYPEPAGFPEFIQKAADIQKEKGGDRFVGRKLGYLLENAGLADVYTRIIPVSSEQIGFANFLDVAVNFRKARLMPEYPQLVKSVSDSLDALKEAPGTRAYSGLFAAMGIKPQ
ncbi:MAG: class I SAM-dependent methyltransferase [bacterium]|nr:class I SAM-dependent methyltransferase [bacterium]